MTGTRPGEGRWFRLAVQALAVIATAEGACPSGAIAQGLASHAVFLRRMLAQLARSGIVAAHEGRAGGYRLARPPDKITLAEIYLAVNQARAEDPQPDAPDGQPGACATGHTGGLAAALSEITAEAEQAVVETYARHSLAEVIARGEAAAGAARQSTIQADRYALAKRKGAAGPANP